MRIAMMIVALALCGTNAWAEQRTVVVDVQDGEMVPGSTLTRAESITTAMFAAAGVRLEWKLGHPRGASITATMSEPTPLSYHPGALAFALPYEGVHITVFYDRLSKMYPPDVRSALLAHVLAHEISHVLQGTDRHSETGIMQANWTPKEIGKMASKPLWFTPEDIDFMNKGLAMRDAASPLRAALERP
jgi:hypothetical protein